MKRITIALLSLVVTLSLSAQTRRNAVRPPAPPPDPTPAAGEALAGLTAAQRTAFSDGLTDFSSIEEITDGLGPVFNERSCAACHTTPAIGGGSTRTVTRFSRRMNG